MTTIFEQIAEDMRFSHRAAKAQADAAWAYRVAREYRAELAAGKHDGEHYGHYVGRLLEWETNAARDAAKARDYMDRISQEGDLIEWSTGGVSTSANLLLG